VYGRAVDEAVLLLLEEDVRDAGRPPLALTLPERSSVQPVFEHLLRSLNDTRPVACGDRRCPRGVIGGALRDTGLVVRDDTLDPRAQE
jgi:hypothetical protein